MKIRVLMVIFAALAQMLAGEGEFEIRQVSDPDRALLEALSFEPAVIVQDLVMDGIDGLALLRRYRVHPNLTDVPVVMLSATEEPETKVEAFRSGPAITWSNCRPRSNRSRDCATTVAPATTPDSASKPSMPCWKAGPHWSDARSRSSARRPSSRRGPASSKR